jgi:hypothetical protein
MFEQIIQLPVIIQGALGSALFALAFWLLKNAYTLLANKISFINKELRINSINAELVKYTSFKNGEPALMSFALVGLIYIAMSHFIKAVICLCLGYFLQSFLSIFQDISMFFALYFLFQSLSTLKDNQKDKNYDEKISILNAELDKLKS